MSDSYLWLSTVTEASSEPCVCSALGCMKALLFFFQFVNTEETSTELQRSNRIQVLTTLIKTLCPYHNGYTHLQYIQNLNINTTIGQFYFWKILVSPRVKIENKSFFDCFICFILSCMKFAPYFTLQKNHEIRNKKYMSDPQSITQELTTVISKIKAREENIYQIIDSGI